MEYSKSGIESQQTLVIQSILSAVAEISQLLRNSPVIMLQSSNKFGDQQLQQDVHCDQIVQNHLRKNPTVKGFASEERPQLQVCGEGDGFIVTYDPLDGSSIVDTNFSVGSIFSIWPNINLLGQKLSLQINAVLAIYGSRTTAIIYNKNQDKVQQLTLMQGAWVITCKNLQIRANTNIFSPGNLRASNQLQQYKNIILQWIKSDYTLSYCGGLVLDIAFIFYQGNGIFINLASKNYKAKLRVLYQVATVAFLIEKAFGKTVTMGGGSLLDYKVQSYDDRTSFAAGSIEQINKIQHLFKLQKNIKE